MGKPRKMNARQFLKKFPESELMENYLVDMGCPECGGRFGFKVGFHGTCQVFDDGTDDIGDHQWTDSSSCICDHCGHGGVVKDFTFKGLDDLIAGGQSDQQMPESPCDDGSIAK